MVLDQSVNNSWINSASGLNDTFQKRKPSRKTKEGFINDINFSFENLSQEKIQKAIDLQPKNNGNNNRCKWWSYQLHAYWICVFGALCLTVTFLNDFKDKTVFIYEEVA